MSKLNSFSSIDSNAVVKAARQYGTPLYLYDENLIIEKCKRLLSMPNAYGLDVRYAMKANSNRTLLKLISAQGIKIDASSLNEARRAHLAGIPYGSIILTTQESPEGDEMSALEGMMHAGLKYNVCSLKQLHNIGDFASANGIKLSMRYHPGIGTGESVTRNTGDKYSCFGVHLSDIEEALDYAGKRGLIFDIVHVHIGSGGDPAVWRSNIDLELGVIEKYFPDAQTVNFGGGLREARMNDEKAADIEALGEYARDRIEEFFKKTDRKLKMEVEPGTFLVAASGYVITTVIDKKKTGNGGFNFLILDGGMEVNTRPLLYGSRHPFYVVSKTGALLSSEFDEKGGSGYRAILAGRCCESGDSQCLDSNGLTVERAMAEPETGDYIAIGGAGAYCSAMSPFNYNSHVQSPELLYTSSGELKVIRKRQTLEQILENEE